MKYIKYILLFTFYCSLVIALTNCRKKAKTDEEIREMIVGVWVNTKYVGCCVNSYSVLEFHKNGLYEDLGIPRGSCDIKIDKIKSANSDNYDCLDGIISIRYKYYIEEGIIFFQKDSSFCEVSCEKDIKYITNKKILIISKNGDEIKYKKN